MDPVAIVVSVVGLAAGLVTIWEGSTIAVRWILRIEAFVDPFPGRAVEQHGPWEFRVAL